MFEIQDPSRPVSAGTSGVVLGTEPGGEPVIVPFFTATRGTRCAVIGDPALPKLVALRALDAGARVQVVTSMPGDWYRLRSRAGLSAERLAVAAPGAAPPCGTRAEPWMIMDDTGAAPAGSTAVRNPWQPYVAVSGARAISVAALRGLDVIVLYRSTPACRAAVVAALRMPDHAVGSLHGIPNGVAAVATAGMVRLVPLRPDPPECALFTDH